METITLTMKEQQRVAVIERVFQGELTMAEAAMGWSRWLPNLHDLSQRDKPNHVITYRGRCALMKTRLVRIGNSRGIRLPKLIIAPAVRPWA